MLSERDATHLWQRLFRGQAITSLTLAEAESVIDSLPSDSPVRLRLATELEKIRQMHPQRT